MDKVIEVKVSGSYLTKDNVNGGVQGEVNSTWLRLAFDESWDGLTKTIVWWDAKGESAAARLLTVDMLEDILADTRTYLAPVPNEATIVSGKCMFGIDGYINGKRQRSVYGQLVIAPGPDGTDQVIEQPTPTQAEQLQSQLEVLLGRIANAEVSAKAAADSATESQSWAAGGTGTREGEDTNNARYWAQLAQELFDPGEGEAGVAITLANHISNWNIHVSEDDRINWDNKATPQDITDATETLTEKFSTARVDFAAEDWAEAPEGVTLTIPQADHKRVNENFGFSLWDGERTGTWNTQGASAVFDGESGDIVLHAEGAFAGHVIFYGV